MDQVGANPRVITLDQSNWKEITAWVTSQVNRSRDWVIVRLNHGCFNSFHEADKPNRIQYVIEMQNFIENVMGPAWKMWSEDRLIVNECHWCGRDRLTPRTYLIEE